MLSSPTTYFTSRKASSDRRANRKIAMTLNQFLLILWARRTVALAVLGLTVLTTLVVSLLMPKQYTVATSVVVDVKSPDPIAGMVLPGMMAPGYMATQVDIINSDRVAQRVVKLLRMDESPVIREQWMEATEGKGELHAWLGALLQKKLDVKPSRESNVINIGYTGADPAFTAAVANAFAQAYIDTNIELRVEPAQAIRRVVRQPDQGAACTTRGGTESAVQLPAGKRHRRRRRTARPRNAEAQRTLLAAHARRDPGRRRQQQAEARWRRHTAGSDSEPADQPAQGRHRPHGVQAQGSLRQPRRKPPAIPACRRRTGRTQGPPACRNGQDHQRHWHRGPCQRSQGSRNPRGHCGNRRRRCSNSRSSATKSASSCAKSMPRNAPSTPSASA
jgi:capsular polysaccharide biosynthesis protein